MEYLYIADRGESQNTSDKNSDPVKGEPKLKAEATCQMDCLEESRGYSQGAKCEVKTKLEMKQWEKKAAESCKKVLKKKLFQLGV